MALDTETDELGVSPIEQLRSVFDLCDRDSDGLLTVNEFRTLSHQFLGTATQQAEKLIMEIDPGESGVINFDNFRTGIQSYLLARRDSSPLSGSCLSLNGFGDDHIITSSPNNGDSIHDMYHTFSDSSSKRNLSYQFNNNKRETEIELIANGSDGEESDNILLQHEDERRVIDTNSLSTLEVQPSSISPMLIARSLAKKTSHSYLHMSNGGSCSHDSTPDWTIDDEQDELTDKLQELSTRLEGLEVDLDSSQAQTIHLKRENMSLRDRIETFEERLREVQIQKEMIEKQSIESLKQVKIQLNRRHEEEMNELRMKLQEDHDKMKQLDNTNSSVRFTLDQTKQECELRRDESLGLRSRIAEMEDNVKHSKDLFKMERDRWKKEQMNSQQEVEAMNHVIQHLRKELEESKTKKKRQAVTTSDLRNGEITILKKEIKSLEEANNRLSAQLLKHGKQLVAEQPKSLLEELDDAPRNEVMKALKEQEEYNERLKGYIEGLLVTIIEKHPELLEVKS